MARATLYGARQDCSSRPLATVLALSILMSLLLAGCSSKAAERSQPPEPERAIRAELAAGGVEATRAAVPPDSAKDGFFMQEAKVHWLQVGSANMQFFRFSSPPAAARAAAGVDRYGCQISMKNTHIQIQWAGRPYFFRRGALIVLYVERLDTARHGKLDRQVLGVLRSVMGKEFAGGQQ